MTAKKKKFGSSANRGSGDVSLNITAMADIFTVLLVFLLMGFSTGAVNIFPSPGITLPSGAADEGHIEALKIEIGREGVQLESKPAAQLANYRFAPGDIQPDGTAKSLAGAVRESRERQIALAGANTDVKLDSRIIVIADEKVPYSTVKAVLATAAVAGYTDFKLAVVKKGN